MKFADFCVAFALGFCALAFMDAIFTRRKLVAPTPEQWRKFLMHVSKQAPTIRRWPDWGIVNGVSSTK